MRRAQCLDWLERGYPTGIDEAACRSEFALPSPFLVTCARGLTAGYASETQRAACVHFLARASAEAAAGHVAGAAAGGGATEAAAAVRR